MNINQVATSPDGAAQTPLDTWDVLPPVAGLPPGSCRRVLYLRIPMGGSAERIVVDANETRFGATFRTYSYDACSPSSPMPRANLDDHDDTVIVELDAPRQIQGVSLSSGAVSGSDRVLAFYRTDGEAIANEPTLTVDVGKEYLVAVQKTGQMVAKPVLGMADVPRAAVGPGPMPGIGPQAETYMVYDGSTFASLPSSPRFVDARFGLRLQGASPALQASEVNGILIHSYPIGPRLGIAPPGDLDAAVFFWQEADEVGVDGAEGHSTGGIGPALGAALTRYLDRLPEGPVPEHVDVALVIASDAPCRLRITSLNIAYHLVQQSFPDLAEKHVLRFSQDQLEAQAVRIELPADVIVRSATLEMVPSVRGSSELVSDGTQGLPKTLLDQRTGGRVDEARWLAQPMAFDQAVAVSGVALAMMATAAGTELLVEVQQDWHGSPSGKVLAAGRVQLGRIGQPRWVLAPFPEEAVLPQAPHWLLVKAARGHAVWLAETGEQVLRVLDRTPRGGWTERGTVAGKAALFQLLSRRSAQQQAQGGSPLTIRIGEQIAPPLAGNGGDRQSFDLTAPLNAYLAAQGGASGPIPVELSCQARFVGFVTVYPPHIVYDLGAGGESS